MNLYQIRNQINESIATNAEVEAKIKALKPEENGPVAELIKACLAAINSSNDLIHLIDNMEIGGR